MTFEAPDVVVVGSVNLDLVVEVDAVPVPGETVIGGDLSRIPGGKGANQAVASARLGRRTAMIGRVGDDDPGSVLRMALQSAGIDTTGLLTTSGVPSGAALIAVGVDGENAIVVSRGANGRLSASDVRSRSRWLGSAAAVLMQLEVPLDAVAAAAHCSRGIVVLNPAPAPDAPLPEDLLARVDVLVPNRAELAKLTGCAAPAARGGISGRTAVRLARGLAAKAVVVTLGADGAVAVTAADAVHAPAPDVDVVDTTGAGDAFCAALADSLIRGSSLADATRQAVRVGAATTMRAGAQPSLPTAEEVGGLLACSSCG